MNWTNIESKKNDSFMTQTPIPCKSVHPHDYPGFDWIPAYITIASASGYSFMTVYMAFIVVGSTFLNGLVLVATYKFKVSFILQVLYCALEQHSTFVCIK